MTIRIKLLWPVAGVLLAGVTAAQPTAPGRGPAAYYYQGDRRVDVEVVLDTLDVKTTTPLPTLKSAVQQTLQTAAVTQDANRQQLAVKVKASSLSDLTVKAGKIRNAVPGLIVRPVIRPAESIGELSEQVLTEEISFQLKGIPQGTATPGAVRAVAKKYKLTQVQPVTYAPQTYTARVQKDVSNLLLPLNTANAMQESGDVKWAAPLILKKQSQRAVPNDPFFPDQWHLKNNGTNTTQGVSGADLNIVPAWDIATGAGINIAITDTGVETSHPDLIANVRTDMDFDFNGNDDDPNPLSFSGHEHGTSCAGVAAATGNNGVGITGSAPEAGIVGLRLTAAPTSDAQEAAAMAWKINEQAPVNQVHINSNSWGPTDNGTTLEGPGPLTEAAIEAGATAGRSGNGVVYVWAAGNGRSFSDNINKDGYANSPYVIAVGASNSAGTFSSYSEFGAPMLVNGPSDNAGGYFDDGIVTVDAAGLAGDNPTDYRNNFGGTSSAAPGVAGVVALMLEVNPALSYRDVMHILVDTATQNNPLDGEWTTNGSGRAFHHNYGFGRVNATDAVTSAAAWQMVPELTQSISDIYAPIVPLVIPDNDSTGVLVEMPISHEGPFVVEHVELQTDITHTYRGDLVITLESPSGMVSQLIHKHNDGGDNYSHWRFRSVAHWGEEPAGTWKVRIADLAGMDTGSLNGLVLRIRGFEPEVSSVDTWELY